MAWSERSDEGAERTERQNRGPDEAGGMGAAAPHLDNRGKFLARLRSQETGGNAPI